MGTIRLSKNLGSYLKGVAMRVDDIAHQYRITAPHAYLHRDTGPPAMPKDQLIAQAAPFPGQLQLSQLIRFQDIHARLVKNKVRFNRLEERPQMVFQQVEVGVISGTIRQADIKVGPFLLEGKIMLGVHGKRKHPAFLAEYFGSAIALVHI